MNKPIIEKNTRLNFLKKQMLSGDAVAESFENAILEQGLTVELICLQRVYYEKDFLTEYKKLETAFADAVVYQGQKQAENMIEDVL